MYHIWSVLDFLPSFFSIVRWSSGSWQFMSSKRLPFEIWSNQVFFSKCVFTNSLLIFHIYYTISNKAFIWGISYQVSFSFHRAEQVMFHTKFHFWTIAKQRFLSYDDDEDEIGCGQWPSPAKPILFLHPSHYIWPQRSLFESGDSQCKADINQRKYMKEIFSFRKKSHFNQTSNINF